MSDSKFVDEFGFKGPLPVTSNQRKMPAAGFSPGPEVGDDVPDFTLTDQHGAEVSFHQMRADSKAALFFFRSAVW